MQVGEQNLVAPQQLILGGHGFFDFEQQVGVAPNLFGRIGELRARRLELGVGDRRSLAGAGLDEHVVSAADQLGDTGGVMATRNSFVLVSVGTPTRMMAPRSRSHLRL